METILLIDDDVDLCTMLTDYLGRHGFRIVSVHNGEAGLKLALTGSYAMALLDVMLPGLDGFEVLRRLRFSSSMSVLLLTARGEDVDRIVGLEIGADDYLPKPFNPRELLARIRAILRRGTRAESPALNPNQASDSVSALGLELDASARTVSCDGRPVALTDVEFSLLQTLMRSVGEVVERERLAEAVLGRKLHPFDRSLDMHISRLRRKLEETCSLGERVKTIRGVGYQLAIPATHRNRGGQ
ncbi:MULTISPECIES: response regulator transcription factor [Acidobacteriaceae]|uniref:response regulator transcription factor n=1 Tax=Acidobacteriaceae TaxID=204434 RepID=UPI00131AB7BD|nr:MULTISPECIES: response regulator transcription factor [Acidobacteriaceae]MDW5266551.1 response regulator transcription factor [Edaphobacter sp.]